MKTGRPPEPVPQHIADAIVDWVSNGNTLRDFCRQEGMPHWNTVYLWLNKDDEFAVRFAQAREIGEEAIAQECLMIADTPVEGVKRKETENGVEVTYEDMLGHRKLQIETRLKLLAKWNPKKWGDKVDLKHSGNVGLNISINLGDE